MLKVVWPNYNSNTELPRVWRVLDLSGMTRSVRESRNYTKAGFVYLNNNRITSLRAHVGVGEVFTLEIRFPNGRIRTSDIMLIPGSRITSRSPRQVGDRDLRYKG